MRKETKIDKNVNVNPNLNDNVNDDETLSYENEEAAH